MAGIRAQMERLLDFDPGRGDAQGAPRRQRRLARRLPRSSTSSATSASTSPSTRWSQRSPSAAGSSGRSRGSRSPSSATCSCRPVTTSTCTTSSTAGCSSAAATSGATSRWASSSSARCGSGEAHAFTWPLLSTAEGRKYGKSVGNAVWLDARRTPVFSLLPALPPSRRRRGGHAAAPLDIPRPRGDPRPRQGDGRAPRSAGPPSGRSPTR